MHAHTLYNITLDSPNVIKHLQQRSYKQIKNTQYDIEENIKILKRTHN